MGEGGYQNLPAATLNLDNFFNLCANVMKLGVFFRNLAGFFLESEKFHFKEKKKHVSYSNVSGFRSC